MFKVSWPIGLNLIEFILIFASSIQQIKLFPFLGNRCLLIGGVR